MQYKSVPNADKGGGGQIILIFCRHHIWKLSYTVSQPPKRERERDVSSLASRISSIWRRSRHLSKSRSELNCRVRRRWRDTSGVKRTSKVATQPGRIFIVGRKTFRFRIGPLVLIFCTYIDLNLSSWRPRGWQFNRRPKIRPKIGPKKPAKLPM